MSVRKNAAPNEGTATARTLREDGILTSAHVVIVAPDVVRRVALPVRGVVTFGRSRRATVRIDDPTLSREHARLDVGDTVTLEDLGSANGTRHAGRRLPPGERVELRAGDSFEVGRITCVLARGAADGAVRPVVPMDDVVDHLRSAIATAGRARPVVSVVYVRTQGTHGEDVAEDLAASTAPTDHLARIAPDELVVLLRGLRASDAPDVARRVRSRWRGADEGASVAVGTASFPADGDDPAVVIEAARSRASANPRSNVDDAVAGFRSAEGDARILALASKDVPVAFVGPPGAGKDHAAERLHAASQRSGRALVRLDLRTLAAADGDVSRGEIRRAVERARGGTLVLREPALAPARERSHLALATAGGDVRVVLLLDPTGLTGAPAVDMPFAAGAIEVRIPALRDRPDEIPALALEFARTAARTLGRPVPDALDAVLEGKLRSHPWPENVRELRAVVHALVSVSEGTTLTASALPDTFGAGVREGPLQDAVRAVERERIVRALVASGWNQSAAARSLGIARNTLIARMKAFGIAPP
ncbi:MAG: FHA domain-containing protein [Polyangiaceae bacterium]